LYNTTCSLYCCRTPSRPALHSWWGIPA